MKVYKERQPKRSATRAGNLREYHPRLDENGLMFLREAETRYTIPCNTIISSADAGRIFRDVLDMKSDADESCVFICLDTRHKILGYFRMSSGINNAVSVGIRETMKKALLLNSNAVIMAHNHPSGDVSPSKDDRDLTAALKAAFTTLEIVLLDHLIIAGTACNIYSEDWYSFADHGEI